MNVLVIGGGGREHALAWRLRRSPQVKQLFAAPGNPGIAGIGQCIKPASVDPDSYLQIARSVEADLTIVGPEAPLAAGVVDLFRGQRRRIIGPTRQAAQLEASKVFSKQFMLRAGVPTPRAATARTPEEAKKNLDEFGFPVVLKADGLAAGKGVIIAEDKTQALAALASLPVGQIVVEEFLAGEEVSFIVFTDGDKVIPLEATQDHKAIGDGDQGPNTGGMGAYCDGRILSPEQTQSILGEIIHPTLEQMKADGTPYTGFLYAGLMMTSSGPKVLEYNARLGDPETQALMHRLDSDLVAVLLDGHKPQWRPEPSVCVVVAAHDYPREVRTGDRITGIENSGAEVFQAGTRIGPNGLETAGGRVLGVTASGKDLQGAIDNAYAAVEHIHFDGMKYRKDIGRKGLKRW
ncbi:MAG: phosphoribosylamine--glycine ligase [Acidimicrobiia bacterium]|nr:phosphoribosylamine--glycine ligase [Acidimicrobiia bacterium]